MTTQQRLEQLLDAVVVDAVGARVGEVVQILLDNISGRPTWVRVAARTLRPRLILITVPLAGAALEAGELRVPHPRALLKAAPRPAAEEGLSPQDERTLIAHYGISPADDDLAAAPAPPPGPSRAADSFLDLRRAELRLRPSRPGADGPGVIWALTDSGGDASGWNDALTALLALSGVTVSVLVAPVLVPGLLRAWSAPLGRIGRLGGLGGSWLIARRSALWRSSLAASAIALLSLAFSFAAVLVTNLGVARAVIRAAHLHAVLDQTDSLALASILGAMALLGAIAVVAMASRSRQREIAVLRCAGTTIGRVRAQVVIEAGLYVGTALIISIVPTSVTAVGEALFLARAGLPFLPRPAVGTLALVALASFAALTAVLLAPVRRAYRAPIGPTLAAE